MYQAQAQAPALPRCAEKFDGVAQARPLRSWSGISLMSRTRQSASGMHLPRRALPGEQHEHTAFTSPPLEQHGHHRLMAVTRQETENRLWDAADELCVAMPEARSPRTARGRRR